MKIKVFERTFSACFEKGTLFSAATGRITEYQQNSLKEYDLLPDDPYFTEMAGFIRAVKSGDCTQICTGKDAEKTIRCCMRIAGDIDHPLP